MTSDTPPPPAAAPDAWSEWLTRRRDGGDPVTARAVSAAVDGYVARLLDGAHLRPGLTLADVGCGEGVVGLSALRRVGPTLSVIGTDISPRLLEIATEHARAAGFAGCCRYVLGAADALGALAEASVDIVTTRAVLAYVTDKPAALREFHRVLRPGGRLSIAEPVFRDDALGAAALAAVVAARSGAGADPFLGLLARWRAAQFPVTATDIAASPLTNYTERDLLHYAQAAGFAEAHLELHIDVRRLPASPWAAYLSSAPHPWAPTLGEVLAERYSAEERGAFEAVLRPLVEEGRLEVTDRVAYVQATKPLPG